jgi:AcrR family transcriptional regulator
MDDLARELSISKKTIYKYFSDKNDLVKSIIEMKVQMDSAVCSNTALQSDNAIDELIQISQLVIEQFNDFNPSVFFDIQKFHKEAWDIIVHHKATFVQNMIRENIERGVKEKIYRENLNPMIAAKLYVASSDAAMNSEIFPWPEFKFQEIFIEMIRLHINGMANDTGRAYLKQKLNSNQDV